MRKQAFFTLPTLIAVFIVAPLFAQFSAHGAASNAVTDLQEQRALYNKAKHHIAAGQRKQFKQIQRQLKNYPLAPYLNYIDLSTRLNSAKPKEVQHFLNDNKHLAVSRRLRSRWLNKLAQKQYWQNYLSFYDDSFANTEQRCFYLRALYKTGKRSQALKAVAPLWTVAKSQPKVCDPLFKEWRAKGLLTEKHIWQRLNTSMNKGQISLAKYVSTLFPAKSASDRRAKKYLKVYSSPSLLNKRHLFNSKSKQDADILIYGIRRVGRSDTSKAINLLRLYESFPSMKGSATVEAKKTIAFHLLSTPTKKGYQWLKQDIQQNMNADLAVYTARLALLFEDWPTVTAAITAMPEALQKQTRWQYWLIRADIAENSITDPAIITQRYAALAGLRDFYGFLAADHSGKPYQLNEKKTVICPARLEETANTPGIQIAFELYATGSTLEAHREWNHVLYRLKGDALIAASQLASHWGWHNAAITATIRGRNWDELKLRFPLAYKEMMQRGSQSANIPLSWAWAIARQESAMRADARSHAGAQGLMQLMPGTAKATIRRQNLGIRKPNLSNASINSKIATAHLGEMRRRFANNRALASAAYNAGPHRVDQWLARNSKQQDLDIWLESTPFKETRNYVQNILMFSAIYQHLQGQTPQFIHSHEQRIKP